VRFALWLLLVLVPDWASAAPVSLEDFARTVRPVLDEHCGACHRPDNPKNRIDFLKAKSADDMDAQRGMWRNVAAQLRNRTMPPMPAKLADEDRLRVSAWIDERLRQTACAIGDYAGPAVTRRLNRREYRNTIRDLFGVDYAVTDIFPADGSGGEGFDTNAETLFISPILMERYLEAAQQILDQVIVTPPFNKTVSAADLIPALSERPSRRLVAPGDQLTARISVYADGDYTVKLSADRPTAGPVKLTLLVDGAKAGVLDFARYESKGGATRAATVRVARGEHTLAIHAPAEALPLEIFNVSIDQRTQEPGAGKKALHFALLQLEPGETPVDPRRAARELLARLLPKAFRRPVTPVEVDRYMALYDRVAQRHDPFEERVKLALKAALVSPEFLFHLSPSASEQPGLHPLTDHELASRLSYFLWSSMPDDALRSAADRGGLRDTKMLAAQVDRLLDSPRSRALANTFIGQWLGTKDIGGRVAPTVSEVQDFYTPEVAADMREEPVVFFHHLLWANASLIDLLNGNYTFLTERLVRFYELESHARHVQGALFQKVEWPDQRRAGLLALGGVLAMTSNFRQTNPVLRGAWVLENLLGVKVPSPPPDIPPLETEANRKSNLTTRQKLEQHRASPACAACHNLMDPIGFGLENFDGYGRWRDTENGKPIDASGTMPSGEKFNGPVELRQILLTRKEEFIRTLTGKMLGYALGRGLHDGDHCTVQRIAAALEKDGYRARTLIREVALSIPFGNSQGGVAVEAAPASKKRERPPSFNK
jgi:cytochrome c553